MKIWTSDEKTDDKIIAYFEDTIYKVNPKPDELEKVLFDFSTKKMPSKNFTAISLPYLREIHFEDAEDYIVVLFNSDSYEHLKIKDPGKRKEVFDYFKNIPNTIFKIDHYSKMKTGKKPLIAMGIVLAVFAWTFTISSGMENGNVYHVIGEQRSLSSIVVGLAALGTKDVLLIFGFLFAIALASFLYKTKKVKTIQKIIVQRLG